MVQQSLVVTTTADDGPGSLRQAILGANALPGLDTIIFSIPKTDAGYHSDTQSFTIRPILALPTITDPVVIDGNTQPGNPPHPQIELDGRATSYGLVGLAITAGNSTVRGLAINRFQSGVYLSGGGNNVIEGNYIGTDVTSTLVLGNRAGVEIFNSSNNTVGGTTAAARNVISGNMYGVYIQGTAATGNTVAGNYIGTDAAGSSALANGHGVLIDSASSNTVGGTTTGARNVISGNGGSGILIRSDAWSNTVAGNYIGTDATGSSALANGYGVSIYSSYSNTVGGSTTLGRNVISANRNSGIYLYESAWNTVAGNYIGADKTGLRPLGNQGDGVFMQFPFFDKIGDPGVAPNTIAFNSGAGVRIVSYAPFNSVGISIRGNAIYSNGGLGIDLGGDGVTANDTGDADTGPNNFQNYPVLTSAVAGTQTRIAGSLSSTSNTTFTLDFYATDSAGVQRWIGSATITVSGSGTASFLLYVGKTKRGERITATATDPLGNTSEFSLGIAAT